MTVAVASGRTIRTPPPCAPYPDVFDSTDRNDHLIAKQICATCPVIDWCRGELKQARINAERREPEYGPTGTWAGELVGRTERKRR